MASFKSILKLLIPTAIMAILAVLVVIFVPGISTIFTSAKTPTSPPATPTLSPDQYNQQLAIKTALEDAIKKRTEVLAFQLFKTQVNSIHYSPGDKEALAFLQLIDPQTGQIASPEPYLVIVRLNPQANALAASSWAVTLPSDNDYLPALKTLPNDLITPELHDLYIPSAQAVAAPAVGPFGGYHLPWAAGQGKRLEGSIGHFLIYNSCSEAYCRYAFDFADGTHFPIAAAKGGTVYGFRWSCPNRPEDLSLPPGDCTNYISLEDRSTTPTTYQIYLHLAYNTIPVGLRSIGAQVSQGDLLADADNTGYSYGSHVHFMVVADPIGGSGGYTWGHSVDITFDEVTVNGGRPRTCFEASHYPSYGNQCVPDDLYVSANVGTHPPSGDLVIPADKTTISDQTVLVGGWGADDNGVAKLQMIANYAGTWREVGPAQAASPFAFGLDLCSSSIPKGPFDLALRVYDVVGNQNLQPLGVRHLINNAQCATTPPPPQICAPSASQIAIFSGINYTGACALLGSGSYPNGAFLAPVGDGQVSSVMVGGPDIEAVMYDGPNYTLRNDTLTDSLRNLSSLRVGNDSVSSIIVRARATNPDPPVLTQPHGLSGAAPSASDSLILTWSSGGGATKYTAELYAGATVSGNPILSRYYAGGVTWPIGNLAAGTYTWRVQGRIADKNRTQYYSAWTVQTFTVTPGTLGTPAAVQVPFNDHMELGSNGWTGTGLWHLGADLVNPANHAWIFNNGTDYGEGQLSSGDLTSAPISLPAGTSQYLRFAYFYNTEAKTAFWDERWVQVSVNGGSFANLLQLSDDASNEWLHSSYINLTPYAGSTIRLRFHFNSIDGLHNSGLSGWMIDDVTIDSTPPPSNCADTVIHNSLSTALPVNYGNTVLADLCPPGDVDFYQIAALTGEQLVVEVDAQVLNPPSKLNPVVSIFLGPDDQSVLAENDDAVPGLLTDSYLHFTIPQNGLYYIRVKPHDYPGAGGPEYNYVMTVNRDNPYTGIDASAPSVTLSNPAPGAGVRSGQAVITANAVDEPGGSGISHVDFYWHPVDWTSGKWSYLSSDWRGINGYHAVLNTSGIPQGQSFAVYAQAFDRAGNSRIDANWNVIIDNDPPVATWSAMPSPYPDSAIRLAWTASDVGSGLDHFEIQYNPDNTGWQVWGTQPSGQDRQAWFIGQFGHTYAFRLTAFDRAGNSSAVGEINVAIAGTCQGDVYEPGDNNSDQATPLTRDTYQVHTFCPMGDVDWVKFDAEAGKSYLIAAIPSGNSAAKPTIGVYGQDNSTLLAQSSSTNFGQWPMIRWTAPAPGTYYIKILSSDPGIAGPDVTYRIYAGTGLWIYFPIMFK